MEQSTMPSKPSNLGTRSDTDAEGVAFSMTPRSHSSSPVRSHCKGCVVLVVMLIFGRCPSCSCFSSDCVLEALLSVLNSDARLGTLRDAFVHGSFGHEAEWLWFPFTMIAPTDKAFEIAVREKRLICHEDVPCESIAEFFNPIHVDRNLLRHVFPWNGTFGEMIRKQHMTSVNGFRVRVDHTPGQGISIGGARPAHRVSESRFEFGRVIVVDDTLMDYSRVNASVAAVGEQILDVGPFDTYEREAIANALSENVYFVRRLRSVFSKGGTATIPFLFVPETRDVIPSKADKRAACDEPQILHFAKGPRTNPFQSSFSEGGTTWKIPKRIRRPSNPEDMAFMSVLELASLLRQGLTTSVELTLLYLTRLKRADVYLELVITYTEELALGQAHLADNEMQLGIYRSPLHGIPYGLKDLIAVPGYPTTWGSQQLRNQTFQVPSWVYQRLSAAGAVLIAKLATGAMALGDVWFGGQTRNPWNIEESSCGSSSGSGAAVVAGLVPFAIGTETWGSISCPADTMGITAIRPTFGGVGRTGTMTLAWSLDKIGTFCRYAADCAVVMDGMKGKDPNDPSSVSLPTVDPQSVRFDHMTIGYTDLTDQQVVDDFKRTGVEMTLVDVSYELPLREILHVILVSEASSNLREWLQGGKSSIDGSPHPWPLAIQGGLFVSAADYLLASKARGLLIDASHKLFAEVDAVLVPTIGVGSLVGHQNISGYETSPRKDPLTQALVGAPFSDGRLLAVIAHYQEITRHHLKRPPVEKVEPEALYVCPSYSRCVSKGHG